MASTGFAPPFIFLLFPFHTARVFDAWEPNYVKGAINGFSTWFVAALGFWIMPLLFVIAGTLPSVPQSG